MDSDDEIVIYDDDDQKGIQEKGDKPRVESIFSESDDYAGEENTVGMYNDLDDILDDYLNDDNGDEDGGDYDQYTAEEGAGIYAKNIFGKFDKCGSRSSEIEKNVDPRIVSSHLQEIVNIKNEIRELQDSLHDKVPSGGEKVKSQDTGQDFVELENKASKASESNAKKSFQLKRGVQLKTEARKALGKKFETALLKRISGKSQSSKLEEKKASSLNKAELKRKINRNEIPELSAGITLYTPFSKITQTKKMLKEATRMRSEKKLAAEDAIGEDQTAIETKLQEMENIPPSLTTSLRKILQMTAYTSEEKYKVLDARDKLYKIMRDKDPATKTGSLVGTCPDMCPEKERLQREFQMKVSIFEMVNHPKNSSLNHNYAVKQYCRSSADQEEPLPHELRPVSVLNMTMSFLLNDIADHCELSDDNLGEWYMFMWDRTRALRKELTQQGVCNLDTVKLVEQCARFHIHCAERLADQDSSIYDDKINTENLTKCLQTLKYMYKDLAKEDVYCPNEAEFVCYYLLLNLNNTSVFTEFSDMSERLMSSEPVRFALDIMTAWETRNYVRFFNFVNRTTYLNCCILRRYFNEMRLYATKTMIRSYCTKYYSPQIPIYRFIDNLSFEGIDDCCDFFSHCSLSVEKCNDTVVVNFNKLDFQNPDTPFTSGRAVVIIEEKKKKPFSEIMAGGALPQRTYENHVPQNSFTSNGELKLDSLPCKDLIDFANAPPTAAPLPSQLPKPKLFELKPETSKPPKDSAPLFSNIFGKTLQQEHKDGPAADKNIAKYSGEKPVFDNLNFQPTNIFESSAAGQTFGNRTNFFSSTIKTDSNIQNIFSQKNDNIFANFGAADKKTVFNPPVASGFVSNSVFFGNAEPKFTTASALQNVGSQEPSGFRFKVSTPPPPPAVEVKKPKDEERMKEKLEMEKDTESRQKLEVEEEERLRNILTETMKKSKEEAERRERERRKMEEEEKKALEEKRRLEELERQEKLRKEALLKMEEMRRLEEEEEKRKSAADYKLKVENKMNNLKLKYVQWKAKEFFNKWRLKTWETIEDRKMKEYFKELHVRYPPVCTEEHLKGNPYGLIIPNILIMNKCQNRKGETYRPNGDDCKVIENLSPIRVNEIVVKPLEIRAKRLLNKIEPFLWKVVFSVPDEIECSSSKDIETFIDMNFIHDWKPIKENMPLYYYEGCHSTFRYKISVRRVRGVNLYEGKNANPKATMGSNGVIFVVADDSDMKVTKERLKSVLTSRSRLPQIPLIIFSLGEKLTLAELESTLGLRCYLQTYLTEYDVVSSSGCTKEDLISKLSDCLTLAANKTSPVTLLRVVKLSEFCSTKWFDCVWRRIETSMSNYKIVLKDPNFLIECYNSCLDELLKVFTEENTEDMTVIGDEFVDMLPRPCTSPSYVEKLSVAFQSLKLPHWPKEVPKSSHQLKYRIHQYCKKIAKVQRRVKELKWLLYNIIRRSLLWKGLDIYCDEDIDSILVSFPWIQIFQELSRFLVQELTQQIKNDADDPTVSYRADRIDEFSYESSFISKFFKKTKSVRERRIFEGADSSPDLEQDSVIFAYTAALEREANKRKRDERAEENLRDIFEFSDCKRRIVDDENGDDGKGEVKMDVCGLKTNFETLSDRLDYLKKKMEENAKVLQELNGI